MGRRSDAFISSFTGDRPLMLGNQVGADFGFTRRPTRQLGKPADIYIDLGTANTLVVSRKRGLIANEPSVIAYREMGPDNKRVVIAIGAKAKEKIGRSPENLIACHPLKDGVIADLDITEALLRHFIEMARGRFDFGRPRVVISLPHGVTDVEKKAVLVTGLAAGAREVMLVDEPMAAAVGADLPVHEPRGNMIIDIGGGTTEIAVISYFGVVHCETVRAGGHAIDQSIAASIRRKHNLLIGLPTAERVKIEIGSALPNCADKKMKVSGIDFPTNLPRAVEVTGEEIFDSINDHLKLIIEAVRRTLEMTPPELIEDIARDGLVVTGGGALIDQIDQRLENEIGVPVRIANEPLQTIAQGGSRLIGDPRLLERVMVQ